MTQDRKYLGMTGTQVAILAGLAGFACLLFAVAGMLFMRGAVVGLRPPPVPQDTSTPRPTVTPFVIPSITPTATLTPVPYELLIPEGWVQFKTPLAEIWLPKGFKQVKAKASDDPTSLLPELEMIGPASESSIYPAIVMVSYEPLAGQTLDDYMEIKLAQLATNEAHVVERRRVSVNSVDAVRLVMELRVESFEVNDMMFILHDGGTAWLIQYVAQLNDFYVMLDTFEKSVQTFRITR